MHISYQLSHLPSRHRRVNNEAASDERHIHWRVGQRANLPRARGSTGTWETAAPCYAGFKHRRRTKRGNREKWPVVHSSPHRIDIWEAGFSQNFWELSRRLFFSWQSVPQIPKDYVAMHHDDQSKTTAHARHKCFDRSCCTWMGSLPRWRRAP